LLQPDRNGRTLTWARDRIEETRYRLARSSPKDAERWKHQRRHPTKIGVRITGLTARAPLTPLFGSEL